MLMLLLDGLWAGIEDKVTVYEDHAGADLYVAAPGTRNFFSASSQIPISAVDVVRQVPEVAWAEPVRGLFSITQFHGSKVPAYLIGWTPGGRGGPWEMADGRAPKDDDEIAVGEALASRHDVSVGDRVEILGRKFRVTGVAAGADMFMASFIFMTNAAADQALDAAGTTSFVLVGTDDAAAVRRRVEADGFAVLSREELKVSDLKVMTRAFSVPIRMMVGVSFGVGVLVIALTTYSAIIEHQRDYGILKALGANRARLYRLALGQSLILAIVGLVAGVVLFAGGRELIGWVRPQFAIVVTPGIVVRAVLITLAMGLVAAVIPARRLARLDPAAAFRGA